MLQKFGSKFEEWLLPRGRTLLLGLLSANVCVAFGLIAYDEPVVAKPSVAIAPADRQIQLLTEVPAASPLPMVEPRECRIWGPERDPRAFDSLVEQLQANGGFPELRTMEVKADPDYLVYVGELGSRDNAKRVARELTALNIDSYLIQRDDGSLILSVGLFSKQKLAENQLDRVSSLGYAVFLDALERAQTVYQLSAHVQKDSQAYKTSTSACMAIAHNT